MRVVVLTGMLVGAPSLSGWAAALHHSDQDISKCFAEICQKADCKGAEAANKQAFSITGNRLTNTHRLQKIIASKLKAGDRLIHAELARRKVSEYYACLGYITSGAVLKIDDNGHFVYQIIEGAIDNDSIRIGGKLAEPDKAYIRQVLLQGKHQDNLNLHEIRHRLTRLKRVGRYRSIKADISPKSLGQAVIKITLDRNPQTFSGRVYVDNHQSNYVGRERTGFEVAYAGFDDPTNTLLVSGSLSEGLKSAKTAFRVSDYRGDYVDVAVSHSESVIIQSPLDDLDIKNIANRLLVKRRLGLWRNTMTGRYAAESNQDATLSSLFTLELLKSRNSLLGRSFSFSSSEVDGRSEIGSIKAQIDWASKSRNSAYSISNHLELGKDLSGESSLPDYTLLGGNVGYKLALNDKTQLTLKGSYQWANANLPSAKKIGLGGAANLRGVANNTLFTDSALFLSAQIDRKLGVFSPWSASDTKDGQIHLGAFVDHGLGADYNGASTSNRDTRSLTSAGLSAHWRLGKDLSVGFSWGKAIEHDFVVRNDNLFYFNLVKQFGG